MNWCAALQDQHATDVSNQECQPNARARKTVFQLCMRFMWPACIFLYLLHAQSRADNLEILHCGEVQSLTEPMQIGEPDLMQQPLSWIV